MPSYDIAIHRTAKRELDQLTTDARERLTDAITDVASQREPSAHEKTRSLEGQAGLLRVRAGQYRAIVELNAPELRVLRVGHRDTVYDVLNNGLNDRRVTA